jgi:predicted dehydrogenase
MKNVYNVGIIGVGVVGERLIKTFNQNPRFRIIQITDKNPTRLQEMAKKYDLTPVEHFREILDNSLVDLVYLAVPPKHHHSIGMKIIESGKAFFCEKPLANSTKEALDMYTFAEEKGVINAMNFPLPYTGAVNKAKNLIQQDYLGKLRRVELTGYFAEWPRHWQQNPWIDTREQGGFIREVFTHYIQLVNSFYGEVSDIQSQIAYPKEQGLSERELLATGKLDNGVKVLFNGLCDVGREDFLSLTLFGEKGVVALRNWRNIWIAQKDEILNQLPYEEENTTNKLVLELAKALDGEPANLVTFKEGYETHKVIEALLQGGQENSG